MQTLEQKLTDLIAPPLESMGLELVQIRLIDGAKRKTLQVLADNPTTERITVDECARASRTISALLDVEEVFSQAFNLEVSSPGIDRPLIKPKDFEKYLGFEAKIECKLPMEGRRRFKGQMQAFDNNEISILVDGELYRIDLNNIASAKLVMTEALLKAHKDKKQKAICDS